MPKKFTILSTLALLVGPLLSAMPTSAVTPEGYVTLDEVIALEQTIAEEKTACLGDTICERNIERAYAATDSWTYSLLANYRRTALTISSVNIATGKIKVIYHDIYPNPDTFGSLYLMWLTEDPDFISADDLDNGASVDGEVRFFSKTNPRSLENGQFTETWLPANTETELSIDNANALLNDPQLIWFVYNTYYSGETFGARIISNCIPDDRDVSDIECHAAFDKWGNTVYYAVPADNSIVSDPVIDDPTIDDAATNDVAITDTNTAVETVVVEKVVEKIVYVPVTEKTSASASSTIALENTAPSPILESESAAYVGDMSKVEATTPYTGNETNIHNVDSDESTFPWWLVAIIIAFFAVVAGFIVPNHKKFHKF